MSQGLPHHLIGTQPFLSALLSYIRNVAAPASLPLDHVIFQSILLCLIAGDKHLILRTPEEDVPLVVRLAAWTMSSIFNLPTHKLKIRSRLSTRPNATASIDTSAFLRCLFLSSGPNSNQTSQDEGFTENSGRKNDSHHHQAAHSRPNKHKKFRSFPNNLAAAVQTHGSTSTSVTEPLLMSGSVPIPDIIPSIFTALTPVISPYPVYLNEPIRLPHSHSDSLPTRRKRLSPSKPPLRLPHALVISGLEYATDLTQRTFANVLADRQVSLEKENGTAEGTNNCKIETNDDYGTWNLPDGFITVYVCPLNVRERPPIHKTLLDKFAMSSNIFITQEIRHNFSALSFMPTSRPFHPHFLSHSNPGTPSPSHPLSLPQTFTPPTFTKPLPLHSRSSSHFNPPPLPEDILPRSFLKALSDAHHRAHISHTLSIYLADIFSAVRHNSHLDATLLTVRASKDAETLIRASRVIGADLTGMELLRPVPQADDFSDAGSQKIAKEPADDTFNASEGSGSFHSASGSTQVAHVLDVSEVDVARIVPRVISHRVRVRDGPEDEILSSVLFGATFKPSIPKGTTGTDVPVGRLTVKGVLVQILSDV